MRRYAFLLALLLFAPPALAGDGKLQLSVVDDKTGQPVACRMHLMSAGKRPRGVPGAPFWHDHFVFSGGVTLDLPAGHYTFEIERGPEYYRVSGDFTIDRSADDSKEVRLRRAVDMAAEGWWSGDLFVRRPIRDIELLMKAEDLHVAQVVTWWNDMVDATPKPVAPAKSAKPVAPVDRTRSFQAMAGGSSRMGTDVLLFNLSAPLALPHAGEHPSIAAFIAKARQAEGSKLWVDAAASYGWDVPMLVALGQLDSIEVANRHFFRKGLPSDEKNGKPRDRDIYAGPFGFARWSQDVYFKLLDCGLRIPPSAGSGSGVGTNPVGYNRVYVHLDGTFDRERWWQNFRAGQVTATNGPLLRPTVDGHLPGHVFEGEEGQEMELEIGLTLSTADEISYLDIVQDGHVASSLRIDEFAKTGQLPKLHIRRSGWFVIRAVCDSSTTYRFAMSGPFYVEMNHQRRISKKAAQFFLDWVYERAREIDIDDAAQRAEVLEYHRKARDFWKDLVAKANAD